MDPHWHLAWKPLSTLVVFLRDWTGNIVWSFNGACGSSRCYWSRILLLCWWVFMSCALWEVSMLSLKAILSLQFSGVQRSLLVLRGWQVRWRKYRHFGQSGCFLFSCFKGGKDGCEWSGEGFSLTLLYVL